jgi:hypothetical protein
MTITASLSKKKKARFTAGPSLACEQRRQRFFKSSGGPKLGLFPRPSTGGPQIDGRASVRSGPAGEQGRFPGSGLLSSALASKDQEGNPDQP